MFTNAFNTGTGPWIGQGPTRGAARPVLFYSRKLTPAQCNYPTYQQEPLAIIEALKSCAHLLLHRHFTVVTDYESLTKLMTQKILRGRHQGWQTPIRTYYFEIEYLLGAKNFLANYLSRIYEINSGPEDIILKDPTLKATEPTPHQQI